MILCSLVIIVSYVGAKIVQFCGHRLHVHPSFSLLLTTPLSPSSLSPSLASLVIIVSFPASLPLTEDILVDTAFNMLTGKEGEYMEACKGIAAGKAELRSLEGEFFAKLPVDGKEACYWWSTEKISNIVTNKDQVHVAFYSKNSVLKINNYLSFAQLK